MRGWSIVAALVLTAAAAPGTWDWHGVAPPPVPADNPMSQAKVYLGRRLFYDADLSADGTIACATCHEQKHAFADGNRTHPGVTGEAGRRNVPGLANVAWIAPLTDADPRQTTLEAQVSTPVTGTHPIEMGMAGRTGEIAARLGADPCYRAMFAAAFPGDGRIDFIHIARALASFERTLISHGSAWDRGGLTGPAAAGAMLFARDCAACHAGPNFSDGAYHRLGAVDPTAPDQGAFEVTGRAADRGRFRTPSLRNVALTGPWWHDGSASTLAEAIARHGTPYDAADTAQLVAFLGAFSDPEFTRRVSLSLPVEACGKPL